jgi:anthranilate/para-aminobenzoate synthase component I
MPSDLPTICQERARLLRKYSDDASHYASSVRQMSDLVISGDEVGANVSRRICRTAWDDTEKSRLALYRHEADHNCATSAIIRHISEA